MDIIAKSYKQWHFGDVYPEVGEKVYVLYERDTYDSTEPAIGEATLSYNEGKNPKFIWNLVEEDGVVITWALAGGHSVYAWRYVDAIYPKE